MNKKIILVAVLANVIAVPAFATKVSANEYLPHWEDHAFEDKIQMGGCHLTGSDMTGLSKIVYC